MMLRPTERVRCVRRNKPTLIYCATWEEFKSIVEKHYSGWSIVFTGIKARVNPFSVHRIKLTWVKI